MASGSCINAPSWAQMGINGMLTGSSHYPETTHFDTEAEALLLGGFEG